MNEAKTSAKVSDNEACWLPPWTVEETAPATEIPSGPIFRGMLNRLIKEALQGGSKQAAFKLERLAFESVIALSGTCLENPRLFAFAEFATLWPSIRGTHPETNEWAENVTAKINLGKKSRLKRSGKLWSFHNVESHIAYHLFALMERLSPKKPVSLVYLLKDLDAGEILLTKEHKEKIKRLPPLSRDSYKLWFNCSMPIFEKAFGADFENHEKFSHYWRNATYKDQTNVRALIRRDIKKKIQQAFRSIAPKSPPV